MKTVPLITVVVAVSVMALVSLEARAGTAHPPRCTVSLQPSAPSPQLVGARMTWTALAANCGAAPVYQFGVAAGAEGRERRGSEHERGRRRFAMARDFSLDNAFAWAPMEEGGYEIKVEVKDGFDAVSATDTIASFEVSSRVTGDDAVVTPTLNPLVALYSAPPCRHGALRVRFRPAGGPPDTPWTSTNTLPCEHGRSRNFVVAGMRANTTYEMVHRDGDGEDGDEDAPVASLLFTTGTPPATLSIPAFTVRQAPGPGAELRRDLIYHNLASRPAANHVNLLATDLSGGLVWYYDPLASGLIGIGLPGSAPLPKGTVLLGGRDSHRTLGLNVLREIDLAGNPLRETNIDAVNAQLRARGQEIIYGFHHEFSRLPSGDIVTLGWTQKTVDVGGTPTRYAGDMLMVLDQDLQVVWTWDAFDHLDVTRGPIGVVICTGAPCPLPGAVDWVHENAVSWSPADGNLVISVRLQDWVIKIDYSHGRGDGHVIWRLGQDGDFGVISSDPSPWFSHQHYAHYLGKSTLLLFDNGNTRQASDPSAHSRGQLWRLDEEAMTATLLVNLDVGSYSPELGTAERMPNGNYVFDSGSQGGGLFGQSIEMLPDGTKVYVQEVASRDYRSFRMSSLYRGVRH
jgi:arylsulfate sulfotransferase